MMDIIMAYDKDICVWSYIVIIKIFKQSQKEKKIVQNTHMVRLLTCPIQIQMTRSLG